MNEAVKYKAFISYSHADSKWAGWLQRSLESFRTPKSLVGRKAALGTVPSRLTPIFRDRDELASSPDLSERINDALARSENLVVVCSPAAARSNWVNEEILAFKKLGRSDRIFCLIVDGDPAAAGTDTDCFPPAIRARYDSQGRALPGGAEPIAADARKSGDGKSLARLKILAGMLGVGLDDLRQRESQRRQRRATWVAAGAILIAAVTILLAANAMIARKEAEQRRLQAERLLQFMVGDLRDSLTPIGRLDLLKGVGEQAQAYFDAVDVTDLSDEELLSQAQVMTQLGEISLEQDDYPNALDAFTKAYRRSDTLLSKQPADGERLFNRSQAEFWIGYVHWRSGSLDDAELWLKRYLQSAEGLVRLDPDRDDWLREVASAHHNLAVLAETRGDRDAARDGFTYMIHTLEELQRREDSVSLHRDIADAVSWLGKLALDGGNLAAALAAYQRSADQLDSVWEENRSNALVQFDLAFALQRLASVASDMGNLEGAVREAGRAIELFDELVRLDQSNSKYRYSSAVPRLTKANCLAAERRWGEARNLVDEAITNLQQPGQDTSADFNTRFNLASAQYLAARHERVKGNLPGATGFSDQALGNMEAILQADRMNDTRLALVAQLRVLRGEIAVASGDPEGARAEWRQAETLLEDRVAVSSSPRLLDPWARVLYLTGREDQARAVTDALSAHRYVPLWPWPDSPG
ncbi:MAG: toll/interleukin-1 receptor domain-containing protein [Lysobacterales bacterium]